MHYFHCNDNGTMYFPSDFDRLSAPLVMGTILFVLNTRCSHCQRLMDRMIQGIKTTNICILYDTFYPKEIHEKTGVFVDEPIQDFPHAILVGKKNKILTILEMNEIVF